MHPDPLKDFDELSIVIPVHEETSYLPTLLTHIATLPNKKVEVLIVWDGTPPVAYPDIGIRYLSSIHLPRNKGPSHARNIGLNLATRKWIMFVDADDLIIPTGLESMLGTLQKNPNYSCVSGTVPSLIDKHGRFITFKPLVEAQWNPKEAVIDTNFFAGGKKLMPNIGRFIFDRASLVELGGFDESLRRAEDWDLLLRWTNRWPILQSHAPVLYYRLHEANHTLRWEADQIRADLRTIAMGRLVRQSHGLND